MNNVFHQKLYKPGDSRVTSLRQGKNFRSHPSILFPVKTSIKNKGQIKTFYDK